MTIATRKIAILGSTGSIGESTVRVALASQGRIEVLGLSSHRRLKRLVEQAQQLTPEWIVATGGEAANFDWSGLPGSTRLLVGDEGISRLVRQPEIDIVVSAIVGSTDWREPGTRSMPVRRSLWLTKRHWSWRVRW